MPPLILQLRILLRAFSFSYLSPRQAFLTLYSSLIYPFCFFHFMFFSIPDRVHRPNHTLPRQPSASLHKPLFSTSSYTSSSFSPPCALLTFHLRASSYCDGHCTISHAYPILHWSLLCVHSQRHLRSITHIFACGRIIHRIFLPLPLHLPHRYITAHVQYYLTHILCIIYPHMPISYAHYYCTQKFTALIHFALKKSATSFMYRLRSSINGVWLDFSNVTHLTFGILSKYG
jgi:hypothetical protein